MQDLATSRVVLVSVLAFLGLYALLNATHLPFSILSFQEAAGGKTILNVLPYYDAATAYDHLHAYSDEAVHIYYAILAFDVALIIPAYILFLTSGILHAGRRILRGRAPQLLSVLALLPILAGGLNLIEDGVIVVLLNALPAEWPVLAATCGVLTTSKSLLIVVSLLAVAVGHLMIGVSRITHALGLRPCHI